VKIRDLYNGGRIPNFRTAYGGYRNNNFEISKSQKKTTQKHNQNLSSFSQSYPFPFKNV